LRDDAVRGIYDINDLLEDIHSGHNIVASVFVEDELMYRADGQTPMRPVGEVEFVNGIAAMCASSRHNGPRLCHGIIGHADLTLGDHVQPVLEALVAAGNGRLRGIRYGSPWDPRVPARFYRYSIPRHQLLDPTFRKGLALLQRLGLSFDVWAFHPQMPDVADLLCAFPDTSVIVDHVGGLLGIPPDGHDRDALFNNWRARIRELAQFPNLSVKIGGLGMLSCGWDFHLRDAPPSSEELAAAWRPYVEATIEAFGANRCMMESKFPVDKQSCGYGVLWNAMKRITRAYSAAEKAALYHDTAARVYRLA
jgi:predicted TIM-barrel fold metal-dependent hydrolase